MNFDKIIQQLEESMNRLSSISLSDTHTKTEINRANSIQATAKALVSVAVTKDKLIKSQVSTKNTISSLEKED